MFLEIKVKHENLIGDDDIPIKEINTSPYITNVITFFLFDLHHLIMMFSNYTR